MRTTPGEDDFNAIDPDVFTDRDGSQWLALGSFWSGIKLRRLDPDTGMPAGDELHALATRPDPGAVEGPSIVRRGRFYYLFASFDFCCRGVNSDYRLMVGRATNVLGPYVDRDGRPMLEGGGTELLRGYNEFAGPGGADVYGNWLVHHYYDRTDDGVPKLSVRRLRWRDGWPELGDPLSGSSGPGHGPAYLKITERESGEPGRRHGLRLRGRGHPARRRPAQPVRAVARRAPRRQLVQPEQPLQQQGRRGGGVRHGQRDERRPVGLAGQPVPALPLRARDRRLRRGSSTRTAGGRSTSWTATCGCGTPTPRAGRSSRCARRATVLLPGVGRGLWRFRARALGYSVITQGRRQLGHGAQWALLPGPNGTATLTDRAGHRLTTEVLRP